MHKNKPFALLLAAALLAATVCTRAADDPNKPDAKPPEKPAAAGTLTVIDNAGKEQKLKTYQFTEGVRHLGWLAPAAEEKEPAPKDGKDGKDSKPAKPP